MIVRTVDFIKEWKKNIPVLDVRSPGEYNHAHFPNSLNLPLLNDEERKTIGITFKQEGREAAVVKGFELVGPKFADYIKEAIKISPAKDVLIYCWRGGLRSNIMAWLLKTSGFRITLLEGGYKAYRKWVLSELDKPKKVLVIGGKTGCGKTELLNHLKKYSQAIDLEGLSSHRGSAFGGIGLPPQPSNEQFENLLAMEWSEIDPDKVLFLENESRRIGKIILPGKIFEMMREANVIEIDCDRTSRTTRILEEYGKYGNEILAEKTNKIGEKLGGLRLKEALAFLELNDREKWCEMMLDYYDKQYDFGSNSRKPGSIEKIDTDGKSMAEVCEQILKELNSYPHE